LLAVRWCLHVVVPFVRRQHSFMSKFKIVTRDGKTRAVWPTMNVKYWFCIELDQMGVPWKMHCGADASVDQCCFEIEALRL